MRKTAIALFMILLAMLISACSDNSIEEIKEDKESIRGVVELIESDTFTIESKDRAKQGKIIVTKRVESEKGKVDFDVGDTLSIYYEKIEGSSPARINRVYAIELIKKAEAKDYNVDEGKMDSNVSEDYYKMPILSVIKDGKTKELSKENSALVHDVLSNVVWEEGEVEDFSIDYLIMDGVEEVAAFDSSKNMLVDKKSDISVILYKGLSEILKDSLDNQ